MLTNITDFVANYKFDGARATLFQVTLSNPGGELTNKNIPFRVKATSGPDWTTNEIAVPAMGRHFYIPGHRVLNPWEITVMEDEDMFVRNVFEKWQNKINGQDTNKRSADYATDSAYKTDGQVIQYDKQMQAIRQYDLKGVWPVSVGTIQYSWEQDALVEYTVSLRFDHLRVLGSTGDAGGEL